MADLSLNCGWDPAELKASTHMIAKNTAEKFKFVGDRAVTILSQIVERELTTLVDRTITILSQIVERELTTLVDRTKTMAMMGLRAQHTQNQIVALSLSGVVCLRVNLTNGRNASLFGLVTDKLGQVDLSVTVGNAHGGVWNETHPSRRTFYLPVLKTKEAGRLFAAFLLMADTLPSEDQARDLQRAIDNLAIDKNRSFGLNR